jgi:hypothetical protein
MAIGGAVLVAIVAFVAAVTTYLKVRSLALPLAVLAAAVAAGAGALLLRRASSSLRWSACALIALAVGAGSYLTISALPPSSDQLLAATRLVHDSPLRSPRQIHFDGFVNDGQFCIPSCEVRAEQSDFSAGVAATVADIVGRLQRAGYGTTTGSTGSSFVDFEADPTRTVVIRAERKSMDLLISVAPYETGSVVASFAR